MFRRIIATLICVIFSFNNLQYVHAQDFSVNQLPVPGKMIGESVPFAPLALKGLVVNPLKPLEFQFIVDTGEQLRATASVGQSDRVSVNTTKGPQDTASIKDQANQLVKYFLAGLTIPEGDLWVNLSPYEKNRMVPVALGQTDLGRDLLAQDYILKQLTASLIYPEKDLGKEFWSRVYAKAQQQFGTTNVPVNTFNKVWILPDQAQVYENVNAAYVTKSTLKVMLDEDYTALQKHLPVHNGTDSIGSQIVRQIILPEIEKEVNTGKNFAPLRQIYQALILAKWYKETIQNGLLDALYTNKNKVAGVNLNDPTVKEQIYERYLKAYKKGAFDYIKEDPTPDGQVVPRKYFSGGITHFGDFAMSYNGKLSDIQADGAMISLRVVLNKISQIFKGKKETEEEVPSLPFEEGLENERWFSSSIRSLSNQIKDVEGEPSYKNTIRFENSDFYREVIQELKSQGKPAVQLIISIAGIAATNPVNNIGLEFEKSQEALVAISVLGDLGDETAVPTLLKIIKSKYASVVQVKSAVDSLRKIGGEAVFSGLVKAKSGVKNLFVSAAIDMTLLDLMVEPRLKLSTRQIEDMFRVLYRPEYAGYKEELIKKIRDAVEPKYSSVMDVAIASDEAVKRIRDHAMSTPQNKIQSVDYAMSQTPKKEAVILAKIEIARNKFLQQRDAKMRKDLGEALLKASREGLMGDVQQRLDEGADVNYQAEESGLTALMEASLYRNKDVMRLLLKKGANVNAKNKSGQTALMKARYYRLWDVVKILKKADAKDEAVSQTPILSKALYFTRLFIDKHRDIPLEEINEMMRENNVTRPLFIQALRYFLSSPVERDQVRAASLILTLYLDPKRKVLTKDLKEAYKAASRVIDSLKGEQVDKAALANKAPGGIDLNQINVLRTGKTVNVQFDPAQLNQLEQGGFEGFTPVITGFQYISSPFPLLGINTPKQEVQLAKA